jgi:hypothetical protein
MDPASAVIWMFLGIFLVTAVIALASLPGWVRIPDYYRRKLFGLLILEVVACIVAFGGQAVRSSGTRQVSLGEVLLSPEFGWDWQYAQKGWRSRLRFEPVADGKVRLVGDTYLVDGDGEQPPVIIHWESIDAFEVTPGATSVTFAARRTWTQAAAAAYPELKWEVGKSTDVQITVQVETALRGTATDPSSAQSWGLMLTPGFPR